MNVLSLPVLLLNRLFVPVRVATARRAIVLLYSGHAAALDSNGELFDFHHWRQTEAEPDDDFIPLVQGRLRVPRVLQLSGYDRIPKLALPLTRHNLFLRDSYQCQYCGRVPPLAELNLDHVTPKALGGKDSWENLVASCRPCNARKGKRTPKEAGMVLLRPPLQPKVSQTALLLQGMEPPFAAWQPYLATG